MRELYRRSALVAVALGISGAVMINAKPTKPPVPAEPKAKKIFIRKGETNWGFLTHDNKNLHFRGHMQWNGEGVVRGDGRIFILWTELPSLKPAPGVYSIQPDGTLIGQWGYANDVDIDDKGNIFSRNEGGEGLYDDHVRESSVEDPENQ